MHIRWVGFHIFHGMREPTRKGQSGNPMAEHSPALFVRAQNGHAALIGNVKPGAYGSFRANKTI